MRRQGARQVYAVIGHPVAHSLSPAMQNAAFDAAGIDAVYRAIDVPPERLEESLRALHAEGVAGLNVTLPHKEAVYRLLDDATPEARVAEAANTLRRVLGGWTGHATDGLGFLEWADALAVPLGGARVLLLGAGAPRGVLRPRSSNAGWPRSPWSAARRPARRGSLRGLRLARPRARVSSRRAS
jgi:shikimate dehydrogenase